MDTVFRTPSFLDWLKNQLWEDLVAVNCDDPNRPCVYNRDAGHFGIAQDGPNIAVYGYSRHERPAPALWDGWVTEFTNFCASYWPRAPKPEFTYFSEYRPSV